jgi:hypothetical protein
MEELGRFALISRAWSTIFRRASYSIVTLELRRERRIQWFFTLLESPLQTLSPYIHTLIITPDHAGRILHRANIKFLFPKLPALEILVLESISCRWMEERLRMRTLFRRVRRECRIELQNVKVRYRSDVELLKRMWRGTLVEEGTAVEPIHPYQREETPDEVLANVIHEWTDLKEDMMNKESRVEATSRFLT